MTWLADGVDGDWLVDDAIDGVHQIPKEDFNCREYLKDVLHALTDGTHFVIEGVNVEDGVYKISSSRSLMTVEYSIPKETLNPDKIMYEILAAVNYREEQCVRMFKLQAWAWDKIPQRFNPPKRKPRGASTFSWCVNGMWLKLLDSSEVIVDSKDGIRLTNVSFGVDSSLISGGVDEAERIATSAGWFNRVAHVSKLSSNPGSIIKTSAKRYIVCAS